MTLCDRHILVVEDEYVLAVEIRNGLEDAGALVIGPEPSVERALSRIVSEARIDAAVLDVNLSDGRIDPIADALLAQGIPFVFASGYGEDVVASRYPGAPHCHKPVDMPTLLRALGELLSDVERRASKIGH